MWLVQNQSGLDAIKDKIITGGIYRLQRCLLANMNLFPTRIEKQQFLQKKFKFLFFNHEMCFRVSAGFHLGVFEITAVTLTAF